MKKISPLAIVTLLLLVNTTFALYCKPPIEASDEAMTRWMIWFYSSLVSALITTLVDLVYTKLCEIEKYIRKDKI